MINVLLTSQFYCRRRIGSAVLLPKVGNPPNSSSQRPSRLPHIRLPTCQFNTPGPLYHHRQADNRNKYSSNPHSSGKNYPATAATTPAVSSPEYYPTPAPNADVIRKPLLVGRHPIILNISGDCSESVPAFCSKPFAGSLGWLPDFLIWIVSANDSEELITLTGLPSLLASADWSETRIII